VRRTERRSSGRDGIVTAEESSTPRRTQKPSDDARIGWRESLNGIGARELGSKDMDRQSIARVMVRPGVEGLGEGTKSHRSYVRGARIKV